MAVITAIVLTVLLGLMAFVVDYGLVRADTRISQSAGDAASLAGVAALADAPGDYEGGCQVAVDYLEVNLGVTLTPGLCLPFDDATFEPCADRAATDPNSVPPSQSTSDSGPVYVEDQVDDYIIRIQMPVRDGDAQMEGQTIDDFDGEDACKRLAVSIRRTRDTIFGGFAGGSGDVSGFADAVGLYQEGEDSEDVPALIVLDRTGCQTLRVSSNGGKLIAENRDTDANGNPLVDDDGNPIKHLGLISVDSNGEDCGNGAQDYVMRTNSDARLCAGVDIADAADFAALVAGTRDCDSEPDTLRSPSFHTDRDGARPFGRAASDGQAGDTIQPEPIPGGVVKREPADHEWNCRATYPLAGDNWLPHYETDIEKCEKGRAANMDELLDDLASGTEFVDASKDADGTTWQTITGCSPTGVVGDGTTNLYFDCAGALDIKAPVVLNAAQYIVVEGWVNVSTDAGALFVNHQDDDADPVTVPDPGVKNDRDVAMVIRGNSGPGQANGLSVGSSSDLFVNRTMVYLETGNTSINSDKTVWTAPLEQAYDEDTGDEDQCDEQVAFSQPAASPLDDYELPSPECFQNLALWTNNGDTHSLKGGADLEVEGVFFAPYAGRDSGAFDLAGGISQRLDLAQFFTYRFNMSGSSTLTLRPDASRNLTVRTTSVSLIR